jgi:hypothetical protein
MDSEGFQLRTNHRSHDSEPKWKSARRSIYALNRLKQVEENTAVAIGDLSAHTRQDPPELSKQGFAVGDHGQRRGVTSDDDSFNSGCDESEGGDAGDMMMMVVLTARNNKLALQRAERSGLAESFLVVAQPHGQAFLNAATSALVDATVENALTPTNILRLAISHDIY